MFKESFKFYKRINSVDEQSDIIDFDNVTNSTFIKPKDIMACIDKEKFNNLGLKNDLSDWNCYEILNVPGLIFIKNPFTTVGQKYWMEKCIAEYTKKPNRLNIDVHNIIDADEDWWTIVKSGNIKIRDQLRWTTLGYHHNWDTKVYSEFAKSEFPMDLSELSKNIMQLLQLPNEFKAEAAIINYYHSSSTLSGHIDHSEYNLKAPLLSISFGLSAIFLIGGQSLDDKPTAILLKSGDIIIMSRESRLCYHGIPKILISENNQDFGDWEEPFKNYMQITRINLNVRQVNHV